MRKSMLARIELAYWNGIANLHNGEQSVQPLDRTLRNQLDRTIRKARPVGERAARAALEQLGVGEASAPGYLDDDQKALRRRLRAHARSLGDPLQAGVQGVDRLIAEIAYEHWHRMLFARFLAENELLMYDGVAITLDECEELAEDEDAASGWALAARLASAMLPQVFRTQSPVFDLILAAEYQRELEVLLAGLNVAVFQASDSLGWVYQFWQADNKDRINKSEVKIGADELPAVTQLFTEPYMVSFLLDNALGAWWAARRLSEADLRQATSETELREKLALPGVPLEYLRFVQEKDAAGNHRWTPAAGAFEAWPDHLRDLKTLDPCCGSGHFLVAAFSMLVPMRMAMEGLPAGDAVDAVLRENLHGLEIDQRCVELAAFALALAAWRYPDAGGYRPLPELQVACSGLSVSLSRDEWRQLAPATGDSDSHNASIALGLLHDSFKDAPVLGSLINPKHTDATRVTDWDKLATTLQQALQNDEKSTKHAIQQQEAAVVAQGLAKAATLLAGEYHWVITNVPYLSRGKQNERLRGFCERHYPAAKNDLATVFLDRCLELCAQGGTASVVLPQNWLFLSSYRKFREKLLKNELWQLIARLGPGAFETISGEVVKAILITLSRGNANAPPGGLFANEGPGGLIRGVDVSEPRTAAQKAAGLLSGEIKTVAQAKQLENPDARIALDETAKLDLLRNYASGLQGISPADAPRYGRCFWELFQPNSDWIFWQSGIDSTRHYGGKELSLWFGVDLEAAIASGKAYLRGTDAIGKRGIVVRQMSELPCTLHTGAAFDTNCAILLPNDELHLPAIWCFCSSPEYNEAVRRIDQKLNVTNATLVKVPFDLDHWTKVAEERYPEGLPKPYSDDPTQWLFHGHPARSDDPLQVAVARLLGYRWPAELDAEMELSDEARAWVNESEALLPFADKDGIVCIPPVRGEASGADRLFKLLVAAYGDAWSNNTLAQLLRQADHAGKTLESWLRDKFFVQHCKLFQHRPFVWHIWDGLKDGFSALLNYHRLGYKTLETLTYTYLGDWITAQSRAVTNGIDGAEEKLAAAQSLQKSLALILEGEAPYDIFVRWRPLAEQPIGWHPDPNDGVRLNIRPFLSVPDVKKKGAGILRDKPNIKWTKDRGKDVESAPWYHLGLQYDGKEGDRINDHHLSLDEKKAAAPEPLASGARG